MKQQCFPAATRASEQPYSGSTLLAPNGEEARKCASNIAFSFSSAGQPRSARPLNCGRKTRKEKHLQCLSIAAWNVRTLLDRKTNNTRPERRTAIVAMELQRYGIDIAALSETRYAGEGQLTENNYTFYWKGKNENEPRMYGVGFAVSNALVTQLTEFPVGISERLMTLRVKLVDSRQATMISAYAPTLDATD